MSEYDQVLHEDETTVSLAPPTIFCDLIDRHNGNTSQRSANGSVWPPMATGSGGVTRASVDYVCARR